MKLKRRFMKLAVVAAASYLFDPTLGAARRRRLKEKVERFLAQRRAGGSKPTAPFGDAGPAITVVDRNGHVPPTPDPEAEFIVAPS